MSTLPEAWQAIVAVSDERAVAWQCNRDLARLADELAADDNHLETEPDEAAGLRYPWDTPDQVRTIEHNRREEAMKARLGNGRRRAYRLTVEEAADARARRWAHTNYGRAA